MLAHSTRSVPVPSDSYFLLGELRATVDDLEQVCRQLGAWHAGVVDGVEYEGEDARGDGATGTVTAAAELDRAASALAAARHKRSPPRTPRTESCAGRPSRSITRRPRHSDVCQT